jgi:hypothetical protein
VCSSDLGDIEDAFDNACKKQKKKGGIEDKERFCIHCYCYSNTDDNECPSCGMPYQLKCNKCGTFYNKGTKCPCNAPVDKLKNLTDKAWSEIFDLVSYEIDRNYISKKGNPCNKIIYQFKGFSCWEFFVKQEKWAMQKFNQRLKILIDDDAIEAFADWLKANNATNFIRNSVDVEALVIEKDGFYKVSDLFVKEIVLH